MTAARQFMLDTDTVSYVLRGEGGVANKLLSYPPSEICISAISECELRFGADKRRSKRLHQLISDFTSTVEVLPFDSAAAVAFGRICSGLQTKGSPIGSFDTLIASHAFALNATLVTNNSKHFSCIRGLKTANWYTKTG
jgi:tRNA(fMet)-specific endonuclease VapC